LNEDWDEEFWRGKRNEIKEWIIFLYFSLIIMNPFLI